MTTTGALRYGPPLEVKASGDGWELEGFASTYDDDLVGDRVQPGAFRETLAKNPRPPLLWSHQTDKPIGVAKELRETEDGLWGRWTISRTALGADIRQLVQDGAVGGLSIGYLPVDHERQGGVRVLKAVSLHEVSAVVLAANPAAVITGVKAAAGVAQERLRAARLRARLEQMTSAERRGYGRMLLHRLMTMERTGVGR